jgi:hypothetical protein
MSGIPGSSGSTFGDLAWACHDVVFDVSITILLTKSQFSFGDTKMICYSEFLKCNVTFYYIFINWHVWGNSVLIFVQNQPFDYKNEPKPCLHNSNKSRDFVIIFYLNKYKC